MVALSNAWRWLLAGTLIVSCAEPRRDPPPSASAAPPSVATTDARAPAAHPWVGTSTTGSTLQLVRFGTRDVLLIADEDGHALRVADAESLEELASVALGGRPSQVVVAADGRAYVALRDESQIVSVEAGAEVSSLATEKRFQVAAEPVGLATVPDGTLLLVTSAWGATLGGYDVETFERRIDAKLEREPRGVTVSADGQTAFVTHAVGSRATRVHLADATTTEIALGGSDFGAMPFRSAPRSCGTASHGPLMRLERSGLGSHDIFERDAVQGFAAATLENRVFIPHVLVHRGQVTVGGYGVRPESYPSHQAALSEIVGGDARIRVPHRSFLASESRYAFAGGERSGGCLLPRAAATDAHSKSVVISCLGTNEVRVIDTDADTALTAGTRSRWSVPSGPTGIAVDEKRRRAVVWSQFARALSAVALPEPRSDDAEPLLLLPKTTPAATQAILGPAPHEAKDLSDAGRRGRELFHGAGDRRISADGRACASCHPDGREDGLTWPTPAGARQTPMLAGRLGAATKPFGWLGDADTVAAHVKQTFFRLAGTGLGEKDLEALITYCHEMATPPALPTGDDQLVAHGKSLFFADTVGCGSCHTEGDGSDGSRHEVGSGPKLDTPSLAFVAGTAPYFHDGRYNTLGELLEHTQGTMGWAKEMSPEEREALEAYLRTL